ncbi:MAG: ABC transporter permease [Dehalococcoidia bacterium]|nr:ABC transporter permease [Dehalococcoidia bacterium]MBL7165014.1 ABC transporter permease [Dehalococcoidales bacterium]
MIQLRQIAFIALKDLKRFSRDRPALLAFILFPFLFVAVFHFMFSGVGGQDERLAFHLVTRESDSRLSHQIIADMETKDPSQLRPGEPEIVWLKDYDEAHRQVESKELSGFLAFPEDFTEGIMMGYGARLEVVVDAEATDTRMALYGLAQAISARVGAQQVVSSTTVGLLVEQGLVTGEMPDIGQAIMGPVSAQSSASIVLPLIQYETEKVGEVQAEQPSNYVIPGYLVMFVFFAAAQSASLIVRERQNHTLERLLASSVGRESILGGMFIGTAVKGLVQIVIFWTVGLLIFKMDMGLSPTAVVLLSILMTIMSAAFGLMLATLVKTERAAGSIGTLAALILAPLGGCWWPLFILPKWMQSLAKITPHGWANTGFNKLMLFGADFGDVIPEMLALVVFAVIFGIIAIWRFRTSAA